MQMVRHQLDEIVQGLITKSDKIRALGRQGVPTAEIAKYLGIRYQHARNVLVDGGLATTKRHDVIADKPSLSDAERQVDSKPQWVEVDMQGKMQLPIHLCEVVGISSGTRVHVRVNGDAIEVLSQRAALQRAHDIVRKFVPQGVSLVDELIADRRREAKTEEEGS